MRSGALLLASVVRERWKRVYGACSSLECRNTTVLRSIQTRVGIHAGNHWFCSVDCFVAGVAARYSADVLCKSIDSRPAPRRPLGLLLLSKGFITEEQLRIASTEIELRGQDAEVIFRSAGMVSDLQIAIAKAAQWGCPLFGEDQRLRELQVAVPLTLLQQCSAVPLHYSAGRRLVIGFVHRVEHSFLACLQEITEIRPEACIISRPRLNEQLRRITGPSGWREIVSDEGLSPKQMANRTGQFAIEIRARSALLTRYQEFVWTRLIGRRRCLDLLYRVKRDRSGVVDSQAESFAT